MRTGTPSLANSLTKTRPMELVAPVIKNMVLSFENPD
jgi:hypothetical protein